MEKLDVVTSHIYNVSCTYGALYNVLLVSKCTPSLVWGQCRAHVRVSMRSEQASEAIDKQLKSLKSRVCLPSFNGFAKGGHVRLRIQISGAQEEQQMKVRDRNKERFGLVLRKICLQSFLCLWLVWPVFDLKVCR